MPTPSTLALLLLPLLGGSASDPEPSEGYTLFAPLKSTTTYLIDMKGAVVHRWESEFPPGNAVYLLDDGSILRCCRVGDASTFHGGGEGGRIQRIAWDGELLWDFLWADGEHLQHHDIEPMPNGNVMLISWERKAEAEVLAAGRDPALLESGELWPGFVVEIQPDGPTGGKVVWEWHVWDHLIQDRDRSLRDHGVVVDHPEKIDINGEQTREILDQAELENLAELGYIGEDEEDEEEDEPTRPPPRLRLRGSDWLHINSIDYHPGLDQILLSVRSFSEIWIIDHGITSAQAAGPRGDLLYRWGNPQTWRAGTEADRQLFVQHDAQWVEEDLPGAGKVLIFNNGQGRPSGNWSSVDEIALPLDAKGRYSRQDGSFLPRKASWRYRAQEKRSFYSGHLSGTQRLPNGNTLVCAGVQGLLFEVSPDGEVVWEYRNPLGGEAEQTTRRPGQPGGPIRGGSIRGGRGGVPPGRRPEPGRGGGGGPDRGMSGKAIFRATRIAPDHPGLVALATPQPEEAG